MELLLSIIIPIYNVESYIKRCLDSILIQKEDNIEILLINDGSTDKSDSICKEYAKKFQYVKTYWKPNGGPSDARNFGIAHAKGKFLLFLDGDDFLNKNSLYNIMQIIKSKEDLDLIIGRYINYYNKTNSYKECGYHLDDKIVEENTGEKLLKHILDKKTYDWYAVLYIVRRSYLIKHNFYFLKGMYYEDSLWSPNIIVNAKSIRYMDEPFYTYARNREGSITATYSDKIYNDKIAVCEYMGNFCKTNHFDDITKKLVLGNINTTYTSLLYDIWNFSPEERNGLWKKLALYRNILIYSNKIYHKILFFLWYVIGIKGVAFILLQRAKWVRRKNC